MSNILVSIFLAAAVLTHAVLAESPTDLLRQQFKTAQENPGPDGLKFGKLWDCYFVNADDNRSYSASYKFTDFNGVIRGTYSLTKEHAYSYTTQGLMAQLNHFANSYIRLTNNGALVIEVTTNQFTSTKYPAISNSDMVWEYGLCKVVLF